MVCFRECKVSFQIQETGNCLGLNICTIQVGAKIQLFSTESIHMTMLVPSEHWTYQLSCRIPMVEQIVGYCPIKHSSHFVLHHISLALSIYAFPTVNNQAGPAWLSRIVLASHVKGPWFASRLRDESDGHYKQVRSESFLAKTQGSSHARN